MTICIIQSVNFFFVSLQTVATILIFITDVNDEDPVFDKKLYQITLPEVILTHNSCTEKLSFKSVFFVLNYNKYNEQTNSNCF